MWKCKKCGGEVVGLLKIEDFLRFRIDEYEYLDKYDSNEELESVIKENYGADVYYCKSCRDNNKDIKQIAVWED